MSNIFKFVKLLLRLKELPSSLISLIFEFLGPELLYNSSKKSDYIFLKWALENSYPIDDMMSYAVMIHESNKYDNGAYDDTDNDSVFYVNAYYDDYIDDDYIDDYTEYDDYIDSISMINTYLDYGFILVDACINGNLDIVKLVIKLNLKIDDIPLCLSYSVKNNNKHILDWAFKNNINLCSSILDKAMSYDNVNIIRWAHGKILFTIDLLKWASSKGILFIVELCYQDKVVPDVSTLSSALSNGHLHIIKYFHKRKYQFNSDPTIEAVEYGHFHILKWFYRKGYPLNEKICERAIEKGRLDIFEWLQEKKCPFDQKKCTQKVRDSYFVLKLCYEYRKRSPEYTLITAFQVGYLHIIEYLVNEKKCLLNPDHTYQAVKHGHFYILEWLYINGHPWDERAYVAAVKYCRFHILKWLYRKGCPWDERACVAAVKYGHFHILKWLHRKGCPIDKNKCEEIALRKRTDIFKWLHEKISIEHAKSLVTSPKPNSYTQRRIRSI